MDKRREESKVYFFLAYLQRQGQSAGPHPALGGGDSCPSEPE